MSFPPGFSTLAISARVSELWMEELSATRPESTQSKEDAEWEAERGQEHFTPIYSLLTELCSCSQAESTEMDETLRSST